jgi:hypothetical protein
MFHCGRNGASACTTLIAPPKRCFIVGALHLSARGRLPSRPYRTTKSIRTKGAAVHRNDVSLSGETAQAPALRLRSTETMFHRRGAPCERPRAAPEPPLQNNEVDQDQRRSGAPKRRKRLHYAYRSTETMFHCRVAPSERPRAAPEPPLQNNEVDPDQRRSGAPKRRKRLHYAYRSTETMFHCGRNGASACTTVTLHRNDVSL